MTIFETLQKDGNFVHLVTLIRAANLVDVLNDKGPYTLLAPDDEAFGHLPTGFYTRIIEEDEENLAKLIKHLIIPLKYTYKELDSIGKIQPLGDGLLDTERHKKELYIEDARIKRADLECSNGLIQVVEKLILPRNK